MKQEFELGKWDRRIWAVYAKTSRMFFFIGKGKRFCEKKVKELNAGL